MANKPGKRIRALREKTDSTKVYTLKDAVALVKKNATAKFDETIDVVLGLGVDTKSEISIRGMVAMPHGVGKTLRVAVFARGDKAEEAKRAGADLVGAEDLADKMNAGELNFDRCIATPDMMGVVGKLGKVLGPKGLMPNPKLGTVTPNVAEAVKAAKSGSVEFRAEKAGIIHGGIGKASFSEQALVENIRAFIEAVNKAKPQSGVKGNFLRKLGISSSMGVGIKVDIASIAA